MARLRKKIGEILVQAGAITPDQLDTALGMQKGAGKRLGELLVEAGFCKEEAVAQALAKQFGVDFIDVMSGDQVDQTLIGEKPPSVSKDLIKKHFILPLGRERGRLQLAVADPRNLELFDLLRFRLNTDIDIKISPRGKIKQYIEQKMGGAAPSMVDSDESLLTASIDRSLDKSVDKSVDSSIDQAAESAPIIKLCSRIIAEEIGRASCRERV